MPYISKRKVSTRPNKHETGECNNNKWNMFYQDRRWKKLRQWYMMTHPLCVDCLFEGRSVPAVECHHIIPFGTGDTIEEKFELLLDPDNLCALCKDHHVKRHKALNLTNINT